MLQLDDLWIGDILRCTLTGVKGSYEGKGPDGNVLMKTGNKILVMSIENLELVADDDRPDLQKILLDDIPDQVQTPILKRKRLEVERFIDLHIQVLAPEMQTGKPEFILEFQLNRFKEYINSAIQSRLTEVTIIHGKGQGILRDQIQKFLDSDPRVKLWKASPDQGSTEVWM